MKTDLVLFGKHFNMASQVRRRRLVVLFYSGFAALMSAGWFLDHWHVVSPTLIIISASYVRSLVLGGLGAGGKGMIKPFLCNEVRARYVKNPNSSWSRLAELTIPKITDEREFCSDEREVRRRDSAHEMAYRYLGMVVITTFLVAYLKNGNPPLMQRDGFAPPAAFFDHLIYGLLIVEYILFYPFLKPYCCGPSRMWRNRSHDQQTNVLGNSSGNPPHPAMAGGWLLGSRSRFTSASFAFNRRTQSFDPRLLVLGHLDHPIPARISGWHSTQRACS